MLANNYLDKSGKPQYSVSGWYLSEKYDGQRGIWIASEETMYSRNGNEVLIPKWLKQLLIDSDAPDLDGELYLGPGNFGGTGIFRKKKVDEKAWLAVSFLVFDLPSCHHIFSSRLIKLDKAIENIRHNWNEKRECPVKLVKQLKLASIRDIQFHFDKIISSGGEGVILKDPNGYYQNGKRCHTMLKYKKHHDAEAVIIGYKMGTSKYSGMLGAFVAKDCDTCKVFNVSGMSDAVRTSYFNTHPVGTTITYCYYERTSTGKPRHPVYKGIRTDIFPDKSKILMEPEPAPEPVRRAKIVIKKRPKNNKIVLKRKMISDREYVQKQV